MGNIVRPKGLKHASSVDELIPTDFGRCRSNGVCVRRSIKCYSGSSLEMSLKVIDSDMVLIFVATVQKL